MPYASGPSVRRLSKIATLLLAKNYIVMLQRTVDELQRLLVHHQPHQHHNPSTSTAPPVDCQTPSSYDRVRQSRTSSQSPAACQAFTPQNVDALQISNTGSGCVLPPSALPAEMILAMTSLPSAILSERLGLQRSVKQPERAGNVLDWSEVGWQRETLEQRGSGVLLGPQSVAMISGHCRPNMAAGDGLLIPWIDCTSSIPLMAAAHLQLQRQ